MTEAEKIQMRAEIRAYDEAKVKHPRRQDLRNALYIQLLAKYGGQS